MSAPRYCDSGGLLVGAAARLPDDPCEYHLAAVHVPSGCNHMRCNRCQAFVRAGDAGRGFDVRPVAATFYEAADWGALTVPRSDARVYACRCAVWESTSHGEAIDREGDDATGPHMDWACAGHPTPELPQDLQGLEVGADSDWPALVARILGGACPRALGAGVEGPGLWLGWLYAWLLGTPEANALSQALAERADDPDALVRGRVLHFFSRFGRAAGFDKLLATAERSPGLTLESVRIPEHYASLSLFDVLLAHLEGSRRRNDPRDVRAGEALRKAMITPLPAGTEDLVKAALERLSSAFEDADLHQWMAENAAAIERAGHGRWRPVMDLLAGWFKKPQLGHLIVIGGVALMREHAIPPADLRGWIDSARARHRWVDDAWVLPLRSVVDDAERSTTLS